LADIWYITNPGTGASTVLPATSQAIASSEISSSDPLPSMISQSSGMPACSASRARSRSPRSAGYRFSASSARRLPSSSRSACGKRNGFSIVSSLTMPADGCTA
jgi:hypothetical protein